MKNPLVQIDDEIREMTDEEMLVLLPEGWTPDEAPADNAEPLPDAE
jgi:hypothetical protein